METIRIRREGYSLREEHESFHRRFHLLLSTEEANKGEGIRHLVKILSKRLNLTDAEWQIGHTKIFVKRDLASKLEVLAHLRVRAASRVVGKFGRKIAHESAGRLLTAWGSFRMFMIHQHRKNAASIKISSAFRMLKFRSVYKSTLKAIIQLQCLYRRVAACDRVRALRDPYLDMSFKDLEELHQEELSRLEKAVSAKDFKVAAEIESQL